MSFPLTMSGHERTYRPPRSLRATVGAEVTAWDLFRLEHDEVAGSWAAATLESVVAAAEAERLGTLGCTECLDTGFYGVPSVTDPDLLTALVRRVGDDRHEALQADGSWQPWEPSSALEVLDVDTAADLADAITTEASGLLRLYGAPRAFLPPAQALQAAALISADDASPPNFPGNDWVTFAVVAAPDPGAVMDLVRFRGGEAQRFENDAWTPDSDVVPLLAALPMVQLDDRQLEDVLGQMQPSLTADAPLTVSPDPRAERLRRYWSSGRGAAKIRWNLPSDWRRCYRHLRKYMGVRAKGYCSNLHRRNTGMWPGDRRNRGLAGAAPDALQTSPESALLAALRSGRLAGDTEGTTDMTTALLTDGVYTEVDDVNDQLLQNLAASAIPVAPPDEWFEDPKLTKRTTLTVSEDGRVFGHIAPWGVSHIGMAGSVKAPRNRSGQYAYFRTGQLVTASGKSVRVGQLTVAGGHAPTAPGTTVEAAVKHYDDTASGVADVAVGEDEHGIWAAGALRPNVTPEQVRVMRACPPSGDWRVIGGNFELVAACHVNVQGFPIAAAGYSGGALTALVAAGARQMAEQRLVEQADAAMMDRLNQLETMVSSLVASAPTPDPEPPPPPGPAEPAEPAPDPGEENPAAAETQESQEAEPTFTAAEWQRAEKIARAREQVAAAKRQALRDRVTAAGVPPQFLARQKGEGGARAKSTIKGTDSFPVGNVADLKKAIQAFGRAGDKTAAKKHIISMAYKLKRPDLIPDNWRRSQ